MRRHVLGFNMKIGEYQLRLGKIQVIAPEVVPSNLGRVVQEIFISGTRVKDESGGRRRDTEKIG